MKRRRSPPSPRSSLCGRLRRRRDPARRRRLDRGDTRSAPSGLSAAYHIAPRPNRARRLIGAFVEACVESDRLDLARTILRGLAARADALPLETSRGPRAADDWLAALTSRADERRRARIGAPPEGADPRPFEPVAGRLLTAIGGGPARPDAALLLDGTTLRILRRVRRGLVDRDRRR